MEDVVFDRGFHDDEFVRGSVCRGDGGLACWLRSIRWVEDEAGNDGADADLGVVRWSLDNKALELVIARVLPLGDDLDSAACSEGW